MTTQVSYEYTPEKISLLMKRFNKTMQRNLVFSAIAMDKSKLINSLGLCVLATTVEEIENDQKAAGEKVCVAISYEEYEQEVKLLTLKEIALSEARLKQDIEVKKKS